MPLPFDATLKGIVSDRPADFAAVFDLPTNEPVSAINVDLSTVSAATDVALAYGEPLQEIVDLNFQSGPDSGLPGRLHLYNDALNSRHTVSVRSILVLLRTKADSPILTGSLAYGAGRSRVEFGYEVVRLWQEPVESFLHAGLAALPLATLSKLPENRSLLEALREVVQAIDRRLGLEASHAEAVRLMRAAYILTGLRVRKPERATVFQGVRLMEEEMTAYDEELEEYRQAEQRAELRGERRGELRGEIRNSHHLLLRQGRVRFGQADDEIVAALTAIEDLERLERFADAILTAASWKELLATP